MEQEEYRQYQVSWSDQEPLHLHRYYLPSDNERTLAARVLA